MPLDVPGCTRATMIIAVSISFIIQYIASASPFVLSYRFMPFVASNVCISARDKACFESLVGNQLEVMISLFLYLHLYMRRLYPAGLLCQILVCIDDCKEFLHSYVFLYVQLPISMVPHVQLSIHGGDRPLLIVGLGLN